MRERKRRAILVSVMSACILLVSGGAAGEKARALPMAEDRMNARLLRLDI